MALLGWKFLRGIKIQHFKELFHMVFLFKLFLLKKKKKAKQTTHKPFLVWTMASLRKNAEKVIK